MKILFNVYPSAFQNTGGGEILLLKTKEYLQKEGVEVKLFNQWEDKLENFDILHTFGSVKECLPLAKVAKEKGIKTALSPIFWSNIQSGLGYHGSVSKKANLALRHIIKVIFPWFKSQRRDFLISSDILLPSSNIEADKIRKLFGIKKNRIYVVPNGVDKRFADSKPDAFINKYKLSDFILCAGRIEPIKNQLNLIKAMKGSKINVIILGSPVSGHLDYYEQCRKEAEGNIHFLGYIEHDSELLASAYAACKVFVLPSWFETVGLAALEAGLAGANVVITKHGGTREYFKNFVRYIKPQSKKDIREGLEEAFQKEKAEELKKHICENYTWEKVAKKTIEAYKLVLNKKCVSF